MSETTPTRRAALGLLAGAAALAGAVGPAAAEPRRIDVTAAYEEMQAGRLILVDIRRPDEWAASGVPEGAETIDMRDADFVARLAALAEGAPGARIGLICRTGGRSAWVERRLREMGADWAVDVAGGVLGRPDGWVARGLPMRPAR